MSARCGISLWPEKGLRDLLGVHRSFLSDLLSLRPSAEVPRCCRSNHLQRAQGSCTRHFGITRTVRARAFAEMPQSAAAILWRFLRMHRSASPVRWSWSFDLVTIVRQATRLEISTLRSEN